MKSLDSCRFPRKSVQFTLALLPVLILVGCGGMPTAPGNDAPTVRPLPSVAGVKSTPSGEAPLLPPAGSGRGGYYMDDGPGDKAPENLLATPDAEPKVEPYSAKGNRPYVVFGQTYAPMVDNSPFKQRGIGSWYGKKFHGQRTSSGEVYDMYKMTAAHPTLPIPSYARVTNLANGTQIIVRVNDRGPFHSSRIIDLSYTAALKLGYLSKGSSQLEVERLLPEEIARISNDKNRGGDKKLVAVVTPVPVPTPVQTPARAPEPPTMTMDEFLSAEAGRPASSIVPNGHPADTAKPAMSVEPTAAPVLVQVAGVASGFYLQLGAFAQAGSADMLRARMEQDPAIGGVPVEVVQSGAWYRLYTGPFLSREEASAAAQKLKEGGNVSSMIVQR